MSDQRQWIRISDAARRLECSRPLLYAMISDGRLRAYRVAGRLRLRAEDIEAAIVPVEPDSSSK